MGNTYTEDPLFTAHRALISVGRYSLRRELGVGASSTVWAAYDPESGRDVAVTLMRTRRGADGQRPRLVEHARAWQQLSHPNIAKIRDVGAFLDPRDVTGRRAGVYFVRDLVPGVDLQHWLDAVPTLDAAASDQIFSVFYAAGEGLAAAHEAGLIHRDLCPASVIVGYDGAPRVVDFAGPDLLPIEPADLRDAPRYPAPEVRGGALPDALADQYSFCASLYVALTRGDDSRISRRLRAVLARGLAKRPEQRWPSMKDLLRALERSRSGWFRAVTAALRQDPSRVRRSRHRGIRD